MTIILITVKRKTMLKAKFMQIIDPARDAAKRPAVLFTTTAYTLQELRAKFPEIQYAIEAVDIDLEIDPEFVVVDKVTYLDNLLPKVVNKKSGVKFV